MSSAKQRALAGLKTAFTGTAAQRAGMTEGQFCASRLRTFEKRHGKPLTGGQRSVLEAIEQAGRARAFGPDEEAA